MPHLVFGAIGLTALGAGFALRRSKEATEGEASGAPQPSEATQAKPDDARPVGVAPIGIDLSAGLEALVTDPAHALDATLNRAREALFQELGVPVPGVRVRAGATSLPPGTYALSLDDVPSAYGELVPSSHYALTAPEDLAFLKISGTAAVHPVTGKPITCITPEQSAAVSMAHVQVRTAAELLCDHLSWFLRRRAAMFLGIQEVQTLVDALEPQAPALVKAALAKVPVPLLAEVLRRLLEEEVSIRNLKRILEVLSAPDVEGDAAALTERCRQGLRRYLSHKHAPRGPLYAYLVDPSVEENLRQGGSKLAMQPELVSSLMESLKRIASTGSAVLIASPDVRRTLRKLCEGAFPDIAVLTYSELDSDLQIRPVGRVAC
jgi:type III secretion protein V